MRLTIVPFKKTLNKAYQKVKPNRTDIEQFKTHLVRLLDRIDHEESEENVKNHLRDFLNDTWYKDRHLLNTKGRTDLVIHEEKTAQSNAAVLFEVKRPKNVADMISPATSNAKALHELVLYYLRERIEAGNTDVKYLVITNIYDWYIFDAATFDRLFYQNKQLRKEYEDWKNGRKAQPTTDFFYREIAKPLLDGLEAELSAAHFNIRDFEKPLRSPLTQPLTPKGGPTDASLQVDRRGGSSEVGADTVPLQGSGANDRKLIPLFKIFSPQHLLKQPFANDSNSLDKGFYSELLYLIGLEETKEGGKKIIQRCAPANRQSGSLLENTIATLETTERWRQVRPDLTSFQNLSNLSPAERKDEQIFAIALELCITWMNRILFLKLLEAQLVKYHGETSLQPAGGRRFLKTALLKDFDELNELFFEVLAKKPEERPGYVQEKFENIPYLNSSLFEISEAEAGALFISNLKDRFHIRPMSSTVLKDAKGKRRTEELTILEYLFAFLDAYDFASEGSEDIQEENKTLINASVLGLIFEKINGYRDGSFFTPGFITMYMSQETVRRAVVQKFNERYGIDCTDFADLKNFAASRFKTAEVLEMNALVNSLRICDPAVGSGHFLVSVLNEIIAVKSELGILADARGERLRGYDARVENDELIVTCNDGQDLFEYRLGPTSAMGPDLTNFKNLSNLSAGREAQRVQETLFHEKQTIIENCLFGVDINPNSVKICRLRLWIELLKNTYYKGGTESGGLETLPNIDINIKTGNSLISRFALDADLSKALKSVKYDIHTYRRYVEEYHHATDKETKRGLLLLMEQIKSDFRSEIHRNDPLIKRKSKLAGELYNLTQQGQLFGMTESEAKKRKLASDKLSQQLEKLETQIAEIEENRIYENAFEWRFEFPEVLDVEGKFVGFDVVVGNPPYIRQEEFSTLKPYLQGNFQTYAGTADLLIYFIELSMKLLRNDGIFHFIISNKFMRANFGKALREWMLQYRILEILDFGDLPVFEEATTYPCTLNLQKSAPAGEFLAANIPELETVDFNSYAHSLRFASSQSSLTSERWNLSGSEEIEILHKLKQVGITLEEYVEGLVFRGITSGFDKAFVIDKEAATEIIKKDRNAQPFVKKYLIGRDVQRFFVNDQERFFLFIPWDFEIDNYPSIKEHLLKFKTELSDRPEAKQGRFPWFSLSRYGSKYAHYFDYEKIVYQKFQVKPLFAIDLDGSCLNSALWFIPKKDLYLLGILNSKVGWYLISKHCTEIQNGYQLIWQYLGQIPIVPNPEPSIKSKLETLVTQILAQKRHDPQADTSGLEREIDALVYGLYGLTGKEVDIIEGR